MATITHEHLHHMARRHHATMQSLDKLQEKIKGLSKKTLGSVEMGAGAWLGGALEGKTAGRAIGPIPLNLGIGIALLAISHTPYAEKAGANDHLNNLGNGFVASYLAATGYAFGKRWNETGKIFGGGKGNPWLSPYENGWPKPPLAAPMGPPTAAGQWPTAPDLTPAQMAAIAANLTAASRSAAYG